MAYEDQIRVTVNFEQIFEDDVFDIEKLREQLTLFDPVAVNIILSKLGISGSYRTTGSSSRQMSILAYLLDEESKLKLFEVMQKSHGADQTIFNEFALMALLKLNNQIERQGGYKIDSSEEKLLFAKILLAVNSIIFEYKGSENTDELKEFMRHEQTKQFLSRSDDEAINIITRVDHMREILDRDYPEINKMFEEATGLDMKTYYQLIFCLIPGWSVNNDFTKLDEVVARNYLQYFGNIKFDKEILKNFIDSLSVMRSNFSSLNVAYSEKANISDDLWNYITFLNRPLLLEEDSIMCANPNLLNLAMIEGIYNTIRSYIDDSEIKGLDFPAIWGRAYEEYVLLVLENAFGEALSVDIVVNGQASIDAVVELDDTVLLIEIKYAHWKYSTRINPTLESVEHHLGKINRYKPWINEHGKEKRSKKGFGQIKDFYIKYKNGELRDRFDFGDKRIIPVLILGEPFPFDPISRESMESYLENEGCLIEYEECVLPPVVLSTGEVELLEGLIENVSLNKFIELFRKYSFSFREKKPYFGRSTTFNNIVYESRCKFNNSKRMQERLDMATKEIEALLAP